MAREYVERRDHAFYITGSRVPLGVVIHEYKNGAPVESIHRSFPTLTLEQIHGALAFYHANPTEVDAELLDTEDQWRQFRAQSPAPPHLKAKLEQAREHKDLQR
jgi:uncharacterized protein (DUF433 family)